MRSAHGNILHILLFVLEDSCNFDSRYMALLFVPQPQSGSIKKIVLPQLGGIIK